MRAYLITLVMIASIGPVKADSISIGPRGVNATATGLNGTGVVIGQVELARPGKPGKDLAQYVHQQINPFQVYAGTVVDGANSQFVMGDEAIHSLQVAGVMIATTGDDDIVGVAPAAQLHSAADLQNEPEVSFALAANRIANISGMKAINASIGGFTIPGGGSHLTQFIDWSTEADEVLYVTGGAYNERLIASPADNYNGITVGASIIKAGEANGRYRQVWNETYTVLDPPGTRTAVDLLAPGVGLNVALPNNGSNSDEYEGTSYSAPHVTGTVALLQQHANQEILDNNPRFLTGDHDRPEVMKAILLNSADKLDGIHGSDREIINKPDSGGQNWLTTTAYSDPFTSLDEEMGAGHLNANSALENFKPGEYEPSTLSQPSTYVPPIGWDFGSVGAFGHLEYIFNQEVSGWVAITLAWNRSINKTGDEDNYEFGDQFFNPSTPNNIDLYLMEKDSTDVMQATHSSTATDESLEHIFFQVPAGEYKIRVEGNVIDQDFGLAWWAGEADPPTPLGDFDFDGDADGRDFLVWQRGDSPNPFSSTDLSDWQGNYGFGSLGAVTAVPEPGSLVLAVVLGLGVIAISKR